MKTKCPICDSPDGEMLREGDMCIPGPCDPCDAKIIAEDQAKVERAREQRREKWWLEQCPDGYREIDLLNPGLNKQYSDAAQDYDPEAVPRRGLGFIGKTGQGKTRLLFYVLRKCHEAGFGVFAINHTQLCKVASDALYSGHSPEQQRKCDEANAAMNSMMRMNVVLIDDLGKGRPTESANEAFESIVEFRTSRGFPLLWSSNAGGEWLAERLGADRGLPVIRRLAEFCDVVKVEQEGE